MFPVNDEFVSWPSGKPSIETPDYAATIEVAVKNRFTIITPAILTGDAALNLVLADNLQLGAFLILKVKATNAGDDMSLGDGIEAPAIVGVAGKTKTQLFVFDGTVFVPAGGVVQID